MRKLLKRWWIRLVILPLFFFVMLIVSYSRTVKTIPVSFWDEVLWVGRSYFFQYYIHGDFKNPIWQTYEAYDQPKLAEYAFGAWLYPRYLKEASGQKKPFPYTRFLATYGLLWSDPSRFVHQNDEGPPAFWAAKYGQKGLAMINLIYFAREMNVILLAGVVLVAYYFVLLTVGLGPALIFTVLYSANPLLIQTGLKAHSEALFLFLFNASLLCMTLYFTDRKKSIYLILFSIAAGLCMSTKLNGAMLPAVFFVINAVVFFVSKKENIKQLFLGFIPVVLSFIVLIVLNPFTYPNPIANTKYLFAWRMNFATGIQSNMLKNEVLPSAVSRVSVIFSHFYASSQAPYYNGSALWQKVASSVVYRYILGLLSLGGVIYLVRLVFKKNISAIMIISSFVIIVAFMSGYLVIDWDRYFVQLPLFFVLFQSIGLYVAVRWLIRRIA